MWALGQMLLMILQIILMQDLPWEDREAYLKRFSNQMEKGAKVSTLFKQKVQL